MGREETHGLEQFENALKQAETEGKNMNQLVILFTADKDPNAVCPIRRKGGDPKLLSWCSDCNDAFDVLEEAVEAKLEKDPDFHFITAYVGTRDEWKNMNNGFRIKYGINSVPTLLNKGTGKSISEAECLDQIQIDVVINEN